MGKYTRGEFLGFSAILAGAVTLGRVPASLEKDPHDVPPDQIMAVKVNRTVVGGRTVFPKQIS